MKHRQTTIPPMPISGDKVREARKKAGLTQAQLAAKIGIAVPNLSRLEAGRNPNPKFNLVQAIARACGCRTDDLADK